jgi:carbon starvation protein
MNFATTRRFLQQGAFLTQSPLALVTTLLFNTGRGRYAPVTVLPMLFVIATTMTAGVQMCSGKFIDLMRQGQVLTGALNLAMTIFVMTCVATLLILAISRWMLVSKGLLSPAAEKPLVSDAS